jgi:hypothetical protein
MDCIERSQLGGQHSACGIQHSLTDANQFEACKNCPPTIEAFFAFENKRAQDFRACEGARHERTSTPEVATKRARLGFLDRKFYDRGGVEVRCRRQRYS